VTSEDAIIKARADARATGRDTCVVYLRGTYSTLPLGRAKEDDIFCTIDAAGCHPDLDPPRLTAAQRREIKVLWKEYRDIEKSERLLAIAESYGVNTDDIAEIV
jgi:hypothetical protein